MQNRTIGWIALVVTLMISAYPATADTGSGELLHFVTDGCTMFAEGTRGEPNLWRHCCVEHDLHHWVGGPRKAVEAAHIGLRDCVAATGNKETAELMYLGVKLGGRSPIKMGDIKKPRPDDPRGDTHMWGNGWRGRDPYAKHTTQELDLIERRTHDLNLDPALEARFLESLRRNAVRH